MHAAITHLLKMHLLKLQIGHLARVRREIVPLSAALKLPYTHESVAIFRRLIKELLNGLRGGIEISSSLLRF